MAPDPEGSTFVHLLSGELTRALSSLPWTLMGYWLDEQAEICR